MKSHIIRAFHGRFLFFMKLQNILKILEKYEKEMNNLCTFCDGKGL